MLNTKEVEDQTEVETRNEPILCLEKQVVKKVTALYTEELCRDANDVLM